MNRKYKIYKRNGYTYVHYEGFPKGVKIEKSDNLYNYNWGWMTVSKDGKCFEFNDEDHELFFNELWNGIVFSCEGKFGIKDSMGNEVLPPVFDQIEKLCESVFGRIGDCYWEIKECGTSTYRGTYSDTGFFVENEKKGWQKEGHVVISAIYDNIWHPLDSNFYLVQQDEEWFYINEKEERVLTNVREIEGATNQIPFPFRTGENDVIVLQEYIGHEDVNDTNNVFLHGVWQRLDRISGKKICTMLVNPND